MPCIRIAIGILKIYFNFKNYILLIIKQIYMDGKQQAHLVQRPAIC